MDILPSDLIYLLGTTYQVAWPLMILSKRYYFTLRQRSHQVSLAEILKVVSDEPFEDIGLILHSPLTQVCGERMYYTFVSNGVGIRPIDLNSKEITIPDFRSVCCDSKESAIKEIKKFYRPEYWVDPIYYYKILTQRSFCVKNINNYATRRTQDIIIESIRRFKEWSETHPTIKNNNIELHCYQSSVKAMLQNINSPLLIELEPLLS